MPLCIELFVEIISVTAGVYKPDQRQKKLNTLQFSHMFAGRQFAQMKEPKHHLFQ